MLPRWPWASLGSDSKESACHVRHPSFIPGSKRSPGEGNGHLLQYTCLENSMDRGAWLATVHGVTKSQTWRRTNTFPGGARGKESACPCRRRRRRRRHRLDPWVWKIPPGEGNGNPLLYSCLGNPTERGAWQVTVDGVTESQTRLGTAQHDMEVLTTTFSLRKWFVWVSDVSTKF